MNDPQKIEQLLRETLGPDANIVRVPDIVVTKKENSK